MKKLPFFVILLELALMSAQNSPNETNIDSTIYESDSPTVEPINPPESKPLTLYGFGGFKPVSKKDNKNAEEKNEITWNTYFKHTPGKPKPKVITYVIYIFVLFRRLEEEKGRYIEKTVSCELNKELNGFLQYDCSTELTEDVEVEKIDKITLDPTTFTFDGEAVEAKDVEVSQSASSEMENIQEQKEDNLADLVDESKKVFNLDSGKLIFEIFDKKFYINDLTLNTGTDKSEQKPKEGNYNFNFKNTINNAEESADCSLKQNSGGQTYELECIPKKMPFKSNVNHAIGKGMDDDIKDYIINIELAPGENGNVTLGESKTNPNYYRKNSSGLSGGAIAGIVIVIIVALVAVSILTLMLRKKSPEITQESTVGNLNFSSE